VSRSDQQGATRSRTRTRTVALTVSFLAACGGGGGGGDNAGDGSVVGTSDGAVFDAGGSDSGVKSDGSGLGNDGGAKDAAADGARAGTAPTLSMVQARQVGRVGTDLRIDFTGADPDKDISTVQVQLFDSAHAQIGVDHVLPLATAITVATGGTSYVVLTDALTTDAIGTHPDFALVKVTLLDSRQITSETIDATVSTQMELALGDTCDSMFLTNRCASGLGCKGTGTTKCSAGEAPTLSTVGYYYMDGLVPRILMAGNDPDGDVKTYTLRFLDAGDNPVLVNVNNDPTALVSMFTGPIGSAEGKTDFFFMFPPSADFLTTVVKVGVTVTDSRNAPSAELITNALSPAPMKAASATCDPRGFDYCKGTTATPLVCASSGTTNKCTALATARSNTCTAAKVLDPSKDITSVQGSVAQVSLWDQPSGCAGGDTQTGFPDSVVALKLAAHADTVTLSTDYSYTSFDTKLYFLRSCTDPLTSVPSTTDPRDTSSTDPWCIDDQPNSSSTTAAKAVLVLKNLDAATYFIVVESSPATDQGLLGNNYQLNVVVQ
jgi:hypothetical protein